jgi:hypothetical protein
MAGPSRSRALTEVEQETVLNEVLDNEILSNYSSDDDSVSYYDYTQLVPPEAISTNESDSNHEDVMVHDGLEEVSTRFVWEDIDSFPASRESFCGVCGPQFDTEDLDVAGAFESIFDIALVQLIVDNSMVIYRSHPNKPKMDTLQFRLSLVQGLVERHGSGIHCPVHGPPSVLPPPCASRKDISRSRFPTRERR